jgi:hypothetical protein
MNNIIKNEKNRIEEKWFEKVVEIFYSYAQLFIRDSNYNNFYDWLEAKINITGGSEKRTRTIYIKNHDYPRLTEIGYIGGGDGSIINIVKTESGYIKCAEFLNKNFDRDLINKLISMYKIYYGDHPIEMREFVDKVLNVSEGSLMAFSNKQK